MEAGGASRIRRPGRASAVGAWALATLVVCSLAAGAVAGATPISYPDFSSVAGLTLKGDAAQSGSALRLAANTPLQHGSAWAQAQIDTTQSFESRFRTVVHDGSFFPADGMTFTIQSQGLTALGDNGGGHGYASFVGAAISPSVALDMSVYPQSSKGATEQFSIATNGSLQSPLATAPSPVLLYGQPFSTWVDYDAKAHTLEVFVSPATTKPAAPLVSASVDLAGTLGPAAYAGFTAGTGGLDADFDVLGWTVENVGDTTPPTVTCSASPNVLWPPNNKLVPIATKVAVSDSGSGDAGFSLVSVASNEGDVASESSGWVLGAPDTSGFLRASRLGSGHGRIYTLTYEGRDIAGNKASCATTVAVPHDQGKP